MSMMAAPNRSLMTARVDLVERVEGQPKWFFRVEVIDVEPMEGGSFIHPGDTPRVFLVAGEPGLAPGDVFRAEVEYLGGPHGGDVQLHRLVDRSTRGDHEPDRD